MIDVLKKEGLERMVLQPAALLWDIDGTLVDTTELIAETLDYIYKKYFGRSLPYEERCALIGTPLKKQIRIFGELEAFGIDETVLTEDCIGYYERGRSRERILTDVIAVLVEGKRRGIPTGLVTSKNEDELTNTLPRLGIVDYVDTVVSADAVAHPKPAPDGILLALRRFDIPQDRETSVFYIGDTIYDMAAARDAGVSGVGVTWGAAPRTALEAQQLAFLCDTPEALRHALLG